MDTDNDNLSTSSSDISKILDTIKSEVSIQNASESDSDNEELFNVEILKQVFTERTGEEDSELYTDIIAFLDDSKPNLKQPEKHQSKTNNMLTPNTEHVTIKENKEKFHNEVLTINDNAEKKMNDDGTSEISYQKDSCEEAEDIFEDYGDTESTFEHASRMEKANVGHVRKQRIKKKRKRITVDTKIDESPSSPISLGSTESLILRNKFEYIPEYHPYKHSSLQKELQAQEQKVPIYSSAKVFSTKSVNSEVIKTVTNTLWDLKAISDSLMLTPDVTKNESLGKQDVVVEPELNSKTYVVNDLNFHQCTALKGIEKEEVEQITQKEEISVISDQDNKKQFLEDLTKSIVDSETYFQRCLTELYKCAARVVSHQNDFNKASSSAAVIPDDNPTKPVGRVPSVKKANANKERGESAVVNLPTPINDLIGNNTLSDTLSEDKVKEIEKTMKELDKNRILCPDKKMHRQYKDDLVSLIEKLKFLASYKKKVALRPKRKSKIGKEIIDKSKKKEEFISNNNFEEVVTQMEFDSSSNKTASNRQTAEIKNSVQKVVEWKRTTNNIMNAEINGEAKFKKSSERRPGSMLDVNYGSNNEKKKEKLKLTTSGIDNLRDSKLKNTKDTRESKKKERKKNKTNELHEQKGISKIKLEKSGSEKYKVKSKKEEFDIKRRDEKEKVENKGSKVTTLDKAAKIMDKLKDQSTRNVINKSTFDLLQNVETTKKTKSLPSKSINSLRYPISSRSTAKEDDETRLLSQITPSAIAPFSAEYSKQKRTNTQKSNNDRRIETEEGRKKLIRSDKQSPNIDTMKKENTSISLSDVQYLQNLITDPNARFKTTMTIMPVTVKSYYKPKFLKKDVAEKPFELQNQKKKNSNNSTDVQSPIRAYIRGNRTHTAMNEDETGKSYFDYKTILHTSENPNSNNSSNSEKRKKSPMGRNSILDETNYTLKQTPEKPLEKLNDKEFKTKKIDKINELMDDILAKPNLLQAENLHNSFSNDLSFRTYTNLTSETEFEQQSFNNNVNKNINNDQPSFKCFQKSPTFNKQNNVTNISSGVKNVDVTVKHSNKISSKVEIPKQFSKNRHMVKTGNDLEKVIPKLPDQPVPKRSIPIREHRTTQSYNTTFQGTKMNTDSGKARRNMLNLNENERYAVTKVLNFKNIKTALSINNKPNLNVFDKRANCESNIGSKKNDGNNFPRRFESLAMPKKYYIQAQREEYKNRLGPQFENRMSTIILKNENTKQSNKSVQENIPESNEVLMNNVLNALDEIIDGSMSHKKEKSFINIPSTIEEESILNMNKTWKYQINNISNESSITKQLLDHPEERVIDNVTVSKSTVSIDFPESDNSFHEIIKPEEKDVKEIFKQHNLNMEDSEHIIEFENCDSSVRESKTSSEIIIIKDVNDSGDSHSHSESNQIKHFTDSISNTIVTYILKNLIQNVIKHEPNNCKRLGANSLENFRNLLYENCSSSTLFQKLDEILSLDSASNSIWTMNSDTTISSLLPYDISSIDDISENSTKECSLFCTRLNVHFSSKVYTPMLYYLVNIYHLKCISTTNVEMIVAERIDKTNDWKNLCIKDNLYDPLKLIGFINEARQSVSALPVTPLIPNVNENLNFNQSMDDFKYRNKVTLYLQNNNNSQMQLENGKYKEWLEHEISTKQVIAPIFATYTFRYRYVSYFRNVTIYSSMVLIPMVFGLISLWESTYFIHHSNPITCDYLNSCTLEVSTVSRSSSLSICLSGSNKARISDGSVTTSDIFTESDSSGDYVSIPPASHHKQQLIEADLKENIQVVVSSQPTKTIQRKWVNENRKENLLVDNNTTAVVPLLESSYSLNIFIQTDYKDISLLLLYSLLFVCVFSCLVVHPVCQ